MRMQARKFDMTMGICNHGKKCCPHICVGTILFTSNDDETNNRGTARLGDIGVHTCPHCGINQIITCSQTVFTNGMGNARVIDQTTEFCGSGVIVTGSSDTLTGD